MSGAARGDGAAPPSLVTGVDKVNAAHLLTCLLQARRPRLVLQAGIAGAFAGGGLRGG